MQNIINICNDNGVKFGVRFNPKKTKWICTNVYSSIKNVSFNLNGVTIVTIIIITTSIKLCNCFILTERFVYAP